MPIYEYVCADCGRPFEQLVLSSSKVAEVRCPTCQSQHVVKKISAFAANLSGAGSFSFGGSSSSGCDSGSV